MRWLLKEVKNDIIAAEDPAANDDEGWETIDKNEDADDKNNSAMDDVGDVAVVEDGFREQVMNYHGNEQMDVFTYKQWLINVLVSCTVCVVCHVSRHPLSCRLRHHFIGIKNDVRLSVSLSVRPYQKFFCDASQMQKGARNELPPQIIFFSLHSQEKETH